MGTKMAVSTTTMQTPRGADTTQVGEITVAAARMTHRIHIATMTEAIQMRVRALRFQ